MSKCFLAYFDILGYKNRIKGRNLEQEYQEYLKWIENVKGKSGCFIEEVDETKIDFIYFSDTYVFYSNDDSRISFLAITSASYYFMLFASIKSIPYFPMRGAICYGDFKSDRKNNIYVGKALRDAYELENKQEWMGCCLSQECVEQAKNYPHFKMLENPGIIVKYPVPFKKGKIYSKSK